jgi:DNA-binding transcriptional LysR family regulator
MDLAELEVLVAVAQEKGFSRAAERLARTQPAVSQAIRRLEEEVGTRLVDRSSKDGTLTAAGQLLYGHAQQLLNLRLAAETAVRELHHLERGRVAVAANEYTVLHLLDALAEFRRRHPKLRVEVKRSLASEIPSEVLGRDVELGIVTYRPHQPGLTVVPMTTDEIVLLVAPRHPLAGRARVTIRELGGEVFLAHNVRSPHRERVVKAFERHRTPLQIRMELPTLDAIHRLVAAGVGVALSPRRAAEADIARGDVVALGVTDLRLARPVNLVYRTAVELSHAAAAFVACVRERA